METLPNKGYFCTECEEIFPNWGKITRHYCIAKMIGCGLDLSNEGDRALALETWRPSA